MRQPRSLQGAYLVETAWEVCNQMGGIYTVIRSKVPAMTAQWGERYCLLGPIVNQDVSAEFDPVDDLSGPYGSAVKKMRKMGYQVEFGTWLVTGRPLAVLLHVKDLEPKAYEIRQRLFTDHKINLYHDDLLQNQVVCFSELCTIFFTLLAKEMNAINKPVIAHFHEWMASVPILDIKSRKLPIKTVFTTHATSLGRYIAMNDEHFYSSLSKYNWSQQAEYFHILPLAEIERYSAQKCDVLTTVSDVTAKECKEFLGHEPDVITPNGLNIERFVATHEVQNLHQQYKSEIHEFVMGHFFHSSPFDLDNTLYFFTSGRYEYKNKGYDITLEALTILNTMLKKAKRKQTVVMFFITKRPVWSINPVVLQSRGVMGEIRNTCEDIESQIGKRMFYAAASEQRNLKLPDLNNMVDDHLRLKFRRILQSWKSDAWPIVVTHNLKDDNNDEILGYLRNAPLVNNPLDKVKVVYHPDFIDTTNPLFGIDYGEFVRGCHLGIFPSFYEPWGYTPLECLARGVPAITSDYSGFGDFVGRYYPDHEQYGAYLLHRHARKPSAVAKDLAIKMFNFADLTRRERMQQRNKAEDLAENFDWTNLVAYYNNAHEKALIST
nr:glycosyltransferase [Fulvivirga sp. M361]